MISKCRCCAGEGSVPTGVFTRRGDEYVFLPDGNSKVCLGCDGLGIPVRLHEELGIGAVPSGCDCVDCPERARVPSVFANAVRRRG